MNELRQVDQQQAKFLTGILGEFFKPAPSAASERAKWAAEVLPRESIPALRQIALNACERIRFPDKDVQAAKAELYRRARPVFADVVQAKDGKRQQVIVRARRWNRWRAAMRAVVQWARRDTRHRNSRPMLPAFWSIRFHSVHGKPGTLGVLVTQE